MMLCLDSAAQTFPGMQAQGDAAITIKVKQHHMIQLQAIWDHLELDSTRELFAIIKKWQTDLLE
eukprot:1804083-Prorocentrum_lima.AAC.1